MGAKFDNNSGGQWRWYDVSIEAESDLGPFVSLVIENPDGATVLDLVSDSDEELDQFFSLVERAKAKYEQLKTESH